MPKHAHARHLTISLDKLTRSKNRSFASGAAYILRTAIHEPRLGVTHQQNPKGGLLGFGTNGWAGDVDSLCRAASAAERRADSVEGRSLILAMPHELSKECCLRLLATLASFLHERHRVASVFALHAPDAEGDQRNCHGHLVFTSRRVNPEGTQLGEKTREWDVATGSGHTEALREFWTATLNAELETIGAEANIEHRSFERLGIDRIPGTHRGVAKTARMRREVQRRPLVLPLPKPAISPGAPEPVRHTAPIVVPADKYFGGKLSLPMPAASPTPVVAGPAPAPAISISSALESTGRLFGRPLPCPTLCVPREPDAVASPIMRVRPLPIPKIPEAMVEPAR
jgi:hypothetical protein